MTFQSIWIALTVFIHLAAIARVLLNDDINADARFAWILLIVFLPAIGILLYLFFGEPWVARRFRRQASETFSKRVWMQANEAKDASAVVPDRFRPAFAVCEHIGGHPVAGGNGATLAADSDSAINSMIADFDAARETIHVSFYIWLADNNGLKVVEALRRAATRGVTCRVIVDAFGSRDLIRSEHWAAMKAQGVNLCLSLKPALGVPLASISRPDLRNHRKIVVVDGRITYCGSQNCADPQFRIKPKFAPWVDIMLRFEGPVARQNQFIFANDWVVEYGEDLSALLHACPASVSPDGFSAVAFDTGPMSPKGSMSDAFVALLGTAEREVVISTPYFVPDLPLLAAILSCARRGVEVTLILPARNDSAIVAAISSAHYGQLLSAGVTLREYHGGLLHAKTVVVDGSVTLVGSANMDFRSLYLNFENNILFYSPDMSGKVRARQETYIESSTLVSLKEVESRSSARVAIDNLLTILGPVF